MADEGVNKSNRETANSKLRGENLFGETSKEKPSSMELAEGAVSLTPILQSKELDFPSKVSDDQELYLEQDPVKLLEQKYGPNWAKTASPKEMEDAIQLSISNEATLKRSQREVQIQTQDRAARKERDETKARKDEIYRLEDQVARNNRDTENRKKAAERVVEPEAEQLLQIKYGENWREIAPAEDINKATQMTASRKASDQRARKDEIYRLEDQVARNNRDDRQARKEELYRLEDQVARNNREDEQRKSSLEVVTPEAERLLETKYGENWKDSASVKDIQQATQLTGSQKAGDQRSRRDEMYRLEDQVARNKREDEQRKKQEERAISRSNSQKSADSPKSDKSPPPVSVVSETEQKSTPPAQIVSTPSIGENLGKPEIIESSSETYYMVGGKVNPETGELEGGIKTDSTRTIALSGDPNDQRKVDEIRAIREQMAGTAMAANSDVAQTNIETTPRQSVPAPITTPTSNDGALYGKTPEGIPFRVDRGGKVTLNVEPPEPKVTIIPTTENNGLKLAQETITQYQGNKSPIINDQIQTSVTSLEQIEENNEQYTENQQTLNVQQLTARSEAKNYFKTEPSRSYPNINEVRNRVLSLKTDSPPDWRTAFG